MGPPGKRRAPPGSGAPLFDVVSGNSDGSEHSLTLELAQLRHRPIGPGELAQLRGMWWRQASAGQRLPVERGVILIEEARG